MFLQKFAQAEFETDLQNALQEVALQPLKQQHQYQALGIKHLIAAADILEELGLVNQAAQITNILEKYATDQATQNLTSEKMLSNLEHKGWVFNADDGLEVSDQNEVADAGTVTTYPDQMSMNPMNPVNPSGMGPMAVQK